MRVCQYTNATLASAHSHAGLAFCSAVDAIKAGTNVALVVGAEVQTTVSARVGGDYLARASHYARQRLGGKQNRGGQRRPLLKHIRVSRVSSGCDAGYT